MDWRGAFIPDAPLLEIVVRGTVVYLVLFLLLRFVLTRQSGTVGVADLLVIVLIADAAQNAMSAGYNSVTDGLLLVSVIVFWAYALDWLGYHVPWLGRLIRPRALLLVKNGRMLRENMRKELISYDELMSQLRLSGLEDVSEVERAYMEENGRISVVAKSGRQPSGEKNERGAT